MAYGLFHSHYQPQNANTLRPSPFTGMLITDETRPEVKPSFDDRLTVREARVPGHGVGHGVGQERHAAEGGDERHLVGHVQGGRQERHADFFVQSSYRVGIEKFYNDRPINHTSKLGLYHFHCKAKAPLKEAVLQIFLIKWKVRSL